MAHENLKRALMKDLKPFKNTKDMRDWIEKRFADAFANPAEATAIDLILGMQTFRFRLELTAENERRKKR